MRRVPARRVHVALVALGAMALIPCSPAPAAPGALPVAVIHQAKGETPGEVTFVDPDSLAILGTTPVANSPLPLRFDASGNVLYLFDAERSSFFGTPGKKDWALAAVDLGSFASRPLGVVGRPPFLFLGDASGERLYVAGMAKKAKTNPIHVFDLPGERDLGIVASVEHLESFAVSPDGSLLYALCAGKKHKRPKGPPGNLHVLDAMTGAELARFDLGSGTTSVRFDRDRGLAYVLGSRDEEGLGHVAVLRGPSRVADLALPGRALALALGPNGVAYALAPGAVAELSADGLSVARIWRLGLDPTDLVFDTARGHVYAGEGSGSRIAEIDLSNEEVVAEHPTGSPGKKAGKGFGLVLATILAMGAAAMGAVPPPLVSWGPFSTSMALAEDGSALYVLNTFTDDISVFDTATHDVVDHVSTGGGSMRIVRVPEDPHLWVESRARLVRFNTKTREVDREIDLTEGIRRAGVAFDLPRGRVWILLGDEIRVLDLRTGEMVGTVKLPSPAFGVWIDPSPPPSR